MKNGLTNAVIKVAATAGLTLGLTAYPVSEANASQRVDRTLNYTCDFPDDIGNQTVVINIDATAPSSIIVGEPTAPITIEASLTVPAALTIGLRFFGASNVNGTVDGQAHIASPQGESTKTVPFNIPNIALPEMSSFTASATGTMPSMTFSEPGTVKVTVGDLNARLEPTDSNGNPTRLGVINVPCTLNSGQNAEAAELAAVAAPSSSAPHTGPSTLTSSASGAASHSPTLASASATTSDGSTTPSSSDSGALAVASVESSQPSQAQSSNTDDSAWVFGIIALIALLALGAAAVRFGPRLWKR